MAYTTYKKRKTRYRPRKRLYRRKAYRTKRRMVTKYRKKKSVIPYGHAPYHISRVTWTGQTTVDMPNLVNTVVHTYNLTNPWDIDVTNFSSGSLQKPSGFTDMLFIWRECCVYNTFVKIEQEPGYTTNRPTPVYVFLRKKLNNNGVNADTISDNDEMFREVNPKNIRIWGEVDSSWGQNERGSKERPLYMKWNRRKDEKANPWDADKMVGVGGPTQNSYCHIHFMNFNVGGDASAIRYRITVTMTLGFRGRKDGISQ